MGITKREVADQLGVAKQTVVNYIDKLGLAPEHVTRIGKTDILDNFAVSALADALGKNIPPRPAQEEEDTPEPQESVIAALNGRIADLKEQNARLVAEIADMRSARDRELADLRAQLAEANDRAARLAYPAAHGRAFLFHAILCNRLNLHYGEGIYLFGA